MANKCFALLRVQCLSLFGFNRLRHTQDKKEKRRAAFLAGVYAFLVVVMAGYSALASFGCVVLGMAEVVPVLLVFVASFISLLAAVVKTNGVMFSFRDYDMVMSLPVDSRTVILSRFLFLYLMELLFSAVFLIPAGVVYGVAAGISASGWFILALSLPFIPLLPTVIGTLLGTLVAAVTARMRHRSLLTVALSMALVLAVMVLPMTLQSGAVTLTADDFASLAAMTSSLIGTLYPPALLYTSALANASWGSLALFALASAVPAAGYVLLFSLFYRKLNSALASRVTAVRTVTTVPEPRSPLRALYRKELKRYGSLPMYVMNTAMGGVLMLISGIALLAAGEAISELRGLLATLSPLILSFLVGMSSTTSCSLSLEGKSRWIPCSAPVPPRTLFRAKILVGLTILLPCIPVSAVLYALALGTTPIQTLLLFLVPTVYAFFISVCGLALNLKFPQFDWASETTVIKQSASVGVTVLIGFAAVLIPAALAFLLPVSPSLTLAATTAAVAVVTWLLYRRICNIKLYL